MLIYLVSKKISFAKLKTRKQSLRFFSYFFSLESAIETLRAFVEASPAPTAAAVAAEVTRLQTFGALPASDRLYLLLGSSLGEDALRSSKLVSLVPVLRLLVPVSERVVASVPALVLLGFDATRPNLYCNPPSLSTVLVFLRVK